jgi:hypothetical protein
MCPLCISTAAIVAASAASGGGGAFLMLKKRRSVNVSRSVPETITNNLKEKSYEQSSEQN